MENTQEITLEEYTRLLGEFHKRLTGENARDWLDAFKRFLRKEEPWIISSRWKKNIWTQARMGLKRPLKELVNTILSQGFKIFLNEYNPIDLFKIEEDLIFNDKEEDFYFAAISPRELGLRPGNWNKRQLLDAAKVQGLDPCLSGDILEILSQGAFKLVLGEPGFDIGMEPIVINRGLSTFCIARYKDYLHLGTHNGDLHQNYPYLGNVDNKHIFRIRRKYSL